MVFLIVVLQAISVLNFNAWQFNANDTDKRHRSTERRPKLIVLDTMNFWMETANGRFKKVLT